MQNTLLQTNIGNPGSGYVRYAAAMHFYKQGELSLELLEIYRICCKFDLEDPILIARKQGISVPPFLAGDDELIW